MSPGRLLHRLPPTLWLAAVPENDIQEAAFGRPDTEFLLLSERAGGGDGRIYTIVYTAGDQSGNTTPVRVAVRVPHDRSSAAVAFFSAPVITLEPGETVHRLVLLSNGDFDASRVDARWAQVGNQIDVVSPEQCLLEDLNGDRAPDLELVYSADAVGKLRSASGPLNPIGFHYESGGTDYFISNVFKLSAPPPQLEQVAGGSESAPDDPAAPAEIADAEQNPDLGEDGASTAAWNWTLPRPGFTAVEIFNVLGRRIRTIHSGDLPAGFHEMRWDGRDGGGSRVAAGLYFYRVRGPGIHDVRKVRVAR